MLLFPLRRLDHGCDAMQLQRRPVPHRWTFRIRTFNFDGHHSTTSPPPFHVVYEQQQQQQQHLDSSPQPAALLALLAGAAAHRRRRLGATHPSGPTCAFELRQRRPGSPPSPSRLLGSRVGDPFPPDSSLAPASSGETWSRPREWICPLTMDTGDDSLSSHRLTVLSPSCHLQLQINPVTTTSTLFVLNPGNPSAPSLVGAVSDRLLWHASPVPCSSCATVRAALNLRVRIVCRLIRSLVDELFPSVTCSQLSSSPEDFGN
ncbi:hypothetical protein B0T10DRAFT_225497 [Thelonectria olida]|uniref:Uncharacterized protein n=1 Tax=Thelonectria olida TaxID=1576542 RepID=A0A9P8WDC9_9HYPO|nr:hypothetical protein B0T10DRAFT_225497 [Thelonectria olida]